jgi:hypothetical protein
MLTVCIYHMNVQCHRLSNAAKYCSWWQHLYNGTILTKLGRTPGGDESVLIFDDTNYTNFPDYCKVSYLVCTPYTEIILFSKKLARVRHWICFMFYSWWGVPRWCRTSSPTTMSPVFWNMNFISIVLFILKDAYSACLRVVRLFSKR